MLLKNAPLKEMGKLADVTVAFSPTTYGISVIFHGDFKHNGLQQKCR
jgi:hypothetical protein